MRSCTAVAAALLLVIGAAAAATPLTSPSLSAEAFAADLTVLERRVAALDVAHPEGAVDLRAAVPRSWRVETGGRTFEIPAEWLVGALVDWTRHPSAAARDRIAGQLALMREEAAAFVRAAPDDLAARAALSGILNRPEFDAVRGPGPLELLRQRVVAWLVAWLTRLLGSAATAAVTDVTAYVLIGLGAAVILAIAIRALSRAARADRLAPSEAERVTRRWTAWLADAREAAAAGRWRDGVRLAYWTGIVFLETKGVWRADGSRTAREYLRQLPSDSRERAPLGAATDLFEQVWYASAPAGPAEFDAALQHLKQLGCPSV